jgi:type III pantothenate kinase
MENTHTILAIDVGNTQCKLAILKNGLVTEKFVCYHTALIETIEQAILKHNYQKIIICNVVQSMEAIVQDICNVHHAYLLNHNSKMPFDNSYQSMHTLGLDRLALVAAARRLFTNQNTLIISMGTCITYNFINANNVFVGGAIAPGMYMRFKAMHQFTKGLPLIEPHYPIALIGTNTTECMQSGVQNGILAELDAIIAQYAAQFKNLNVVLTGGDSLTFATQIKYKIFADENFLFSGLYEILQINTVS